MHFHTLLLYLARIKLHCTWFSIEYNILYFVAKHCDPLYCFIINCQLLFTLQPICLCTSYEFLNYLLVCALVFAPVTCLCTLVTLYFSSCALVTVQCTCYTCYCALVTVHLLQSSVHLPRGAAAARCPPGKSGACGRELWLCGLNCSICGGGTSLLTVSIPTRWTYGNCPTTDLFRSDPTLVLWEHLDHFTDTHIALPLHQWHSCYDPRPQRDRNNSLSLSDQMFHFLGWNMTPLLSWASTGVWASCLLPLAF